MNAPVTERAPDAPSATPPLLVTVSAEMWQTFVISVREAGFDLELAPSSSGLRPCYDARLRAGYTPVLPETLTDRERRMLELIACGYTYREIGRDIGRAGDTVKQLAYRMFHKLGASDRAHAVARGYQLGLLVTVKEA